MSTAPGAQGSLSRPELCRAVDTVAVVEVTAIDSYRNLAGGIERDVRTEGVHLVKGKAPETITLPGGKIGHQVEWKSETPNLLVGGRYLVFLQAIDGQWRVQGGEAGAVRLMKDASRTGETLAQALVSLEGCHG